MDRSFTGAAGSWCVRQEARIAVRLSVTESMNCRASVLHGDTETEEVKVDEAALLSF
jgi:hypothetical protein